MEKSVPVASHDRVVDEPVRTSFGVASKSSIHGSSTGVGSGVGVMVGVALGATVGGGTEVAVAESSLPGLLRGGMAVDVLVGAGVRVGVEVGEGVAEGRRVLDGRTVAGVAVVCGVSLRAVAASAVRSMPISSVQAGNSMNSPPSSPIAIARRKLWMVIRSSPGV
jgi:hypothetical protein